MPLPPLNVHRHDKRHRALITLSGEIDHQSAPLVRAALARCLSDGIRIIDVDLTPVTFCDCSGLNVFLHAGQQMTEAGGLLRLHNPPSTLNRLLDLTGARVLLLGVPPVHPPLFLRSGPSPASPPPVQRSAPAVAALSDGG